jgi:hypothetical protein
MKYFLNGVEVTNASFVHGNVQYPPNWCALSTKAEKDVIGIIGVTEVYPPLGPYESYGPASDSAIVNHELTRTYSVIRESNAEIVAKKSAELRSIRDFKKKNDGYVVGAHRFHSDPDSRTQQLGLVLMGAGIPAGLQWKTMNGTFVTMTQALAGQILQAAAAHDIALFTCCEIKLSELNASQNPELYNTEYGWPA